MQLTYTCHARARMRQRSITEKDIWATVEAPLLTYPDRNALGEVCVFVSSHTRVVMGGGNLVITVTSPSNGLDS